MDEDIDHSFLPDFRIRNVSKIAFLFVAFAVIAGGAVEHVLSCQMQQFIRDSVLAKHVLGVFLFFFFIMLEGGWDFREEELRKAPVDWASGNALHSGVYAILIYTIFLITSKNRLIPNIILFGLLFILYCINTQRRYWRNRKRISKNRNMLIRKIESILVILIIIVGIYGFIDYVKYKKKNLGDKFSWYDFFLSAKECGFDGTKEYTILSK